MNSVKKPTPRKIWRGEIKTFKKLTTSRKVISSSSTMSDDSPMVPLSSVIDPATTTFVDQLVPVELASVIQQQKKPPKTKFEIATDSSHAHAANARGQLNDAASLWRMISEVLAVKAISEGCTDVPTLVRDQYEILTGETAGKI